MTKQEKLKPEIFAGMNTSLAISLEVILKSACKLVGATREQVVSKSRLKKLVYARHLYSYVAYVSNKRIATERQAFRKSLTEIGAFINCDHSTVLAGKNKIENQIGIYSDVTKDIEAINASVMMPCSHFNAKLVDDSTVGYYNTDERKKELENLGVKSLML